MLVLFQLPVENTVPMPCFAISVWQDSTANNRFLNCELGELPGFLECGELATTPARPLIPTELKLCEF